MLGGSWLYKRQVAEMVLDLTLVCLGLLAAYLIRFDGMLERHFVEQFATLLPWIVSIKLVSLFAMGVYKSIWRYMGTSDMLRLAMASSVGSALAARAIQLAFVWRAVRRVPCLRRLAGRDGVVDRGAAHLAPIRDLLARLRKGSRTCAPVGAGTREPVLRAHAWRAALGPTA